MTKSARFTWTVVMPVKVLGQAKSRLAVLAGPRRPELALAFASDTVSAVMDCPAVARVLVVTSDISAAGALSSLGASVVPDLPDAGLNDILPPAGHPVVFNNTMGFFPTPFGQAGGARPGLGGLGTSNPAPKK